MSAATDVRPEVAAFVAQVRDRLADLTADEREELTGGLEADLSEQHATGDPLPDPTAYADELRAAAGLPAAGRRRLVWRPVPLLDAGRERWSALVGRNEVTRSAWSLAEAVRPAWWVLRAWIAVTLLDQSLGPWEFVGLWPTLVVPAAGPLLLLAAVVVSVLIGQGRLWPGSGPDRSTPARLVLIALNVVAVVAPLTFAGDGSDIATYYSYSAVATPTRHDDALRKGNDVVRNIYAYDVDGQPLTGVQLFDQKGRPVAVSPRSSLGERRRDRQVTCPWFNGTTPLFNVFPLQQRTQPFGTCLDDHPDAGTPTDQEPPLASVPPVTPAAPSGTAAALPPL